ncbi:MAG: hypothetical protein RDU20_21190 [Desulfomonilaceae bacterium]|nr:hypothetical protein [Desulfomonilaceae bacterium]
MADFYINVVVDDEREKKLSETGLSSHIQDLGGKKAIRVPMSAKEHKKLVKSFPDLEFDASNACVLPEEPEKVLFGIVSDMKTLDVMKVAIMKLYNPLAGKDLRKKL